jgi:hypothetical protein
LEVSWLCQQEPFDSFLIIEKYKDIHFYQKNICRNEKEKSKGNLVVSISAIALKSAPAQNTEPSPCKTATRDNGSFSKSLTILPVNVVINHKREKEVNKFERGVLNKTY